MSEVIRDYIGFASLRSVIGLVNSRHSLSQSDAKVKPIANSSLAFFPHFTPVTCIRSSHWLLVIFTFVLIGHCAYFGFGFKTVNRKAPCNNAYLSTIKEALIKIYSYCFTRLPSEILMTRIRDGFAS